MHEDLRKLVSLQDLLTEMNRAQGTVDDTPRLVEEIEATWKRAEEELAGARQRLEDAQKARRTLEGQLTDIEGRVSRYQEQVFQVKKNEEYRALMKEIENSKQEIRSTEDRILEQMERIEEEQGKVQERDRASQHIRVECEQKKAEALQTRDRLMDELKRLEFDRKRLEETVRSDLLALFDKLAKARDGLAVSPVVDESCTLCHVRIRPQVYQELKLGSSLVQCSSCNRFLFLSAEGGKESTGGGTGT